MIANKEDIALMAHLMRRAGFGATRGELESVADQGYEETVEQLLHPEQQPEFDEDTFHRYLPMAEFPSQDTHSQLDFLYRLANTMRPLQEKMALFWHYVFATGNSKVDAPLHLVEQIRMFRQYGMGSYKDLLVQLGKNPAMIFWLDNCENHKRAPNENWGRELLELFSMGIGNYTEKDVFECARAFTGWTNAGRTSKLYLRGTYPWEFEYRPEDHDYTEKTFLGHTGRFNGEDIIDIIVRQPACARFVSRHLYNFFVADEVPGPLLGHRAARRPRGYRHTVPGLCQILAMRLYRCCVHSLTPISSRRPCTGGSRAPSRWWWGPSDSPVTCWARTHVGLAL